MKNTKILDNFFEQRKFKNKNKNCLNFETI